MKSYKHGSSLDLIKYGHLWIAYMLTMYFMLFISTMTFIFDYKSKCTHFLTTHCH